jgi:hypothetical protein
MRAETYYNSGREIGSFAAVDPRITAQNSRTNLKTALDPIPTGPLPESTRFNDGHLRELPVYSPPFILL